MFGCLLGHGAIVGAWWLTCVDLAAEAEGRLAYAGAHDGAVLGLIADGLVLAVLDIVARCLAPGRRQGGEGLEFVTWRFTPSVPRTLGGIDGKEGRISPQNDIFS